MKLITVVLFTISSLFTACYLEHEDDQKPTPPTSVGSGFDLTKQIQSGMNIHACKRTVTTGCFEGSFPASPDIFVEDQKFFDAEEFKAHFVELIAIEGKEEAEKRGESVEVKMLTPISNRSFSDDFEIYIKGEYSKSAKVLVSGRFAVNYLPEGSYDVRVQKPVKFELVRTMPVPAPNPEPAPAKENPEPAIKKESKIYCAKLYAETTIDVTAKEYTNIVFDRYSLYVSDDTCEDKAIKITL